MKLVTKEVLLVKNSVKMYSQSCRSKPIWTLAQQFRFQIYFHCLDKKYKGSQRKMKHSG